jgi:hypothetical protein
MDEVSSRRLRRRLLERAARSMRNDGMRQVFRSLSLVFVLSGVAWVAYVAMRDPERQSAAPLVVTASPGGVFLRESERGIERVIVREGTVTFGVERGPEDPRLVVQVPDGEISDLGTVFSVTVAGGHTRKIDVAKGAVLFDRRDGEPVMIRPGEPFVDAPHLAVAKDPGTADRPISPDDVNRGGPRDPALRPARAKQRNSTAALPLAAPAHGASAEQVALPEPADEDTSYLHVVALLREGRPDEAKLGAADYLRRFPDGFRRIEIERVLEGHR